jgi:hypothetical protein
MRASETKFSGVFSGWGKKTPYSDIEALQLAQLISQNNHGPSNHGETPPTASLNQVVDAVHRGEIKTTPKAEFRYGILYPNGKIKTADPVFEKIGKYLLEHLPTGSIPQGGLPLVVRERGSDTYPAVEKFLEEKIIPYFQVNQILSTLNGKKMDIPTETPVLQTIAWPFFKSVIGGHSISSDYEALAQGVERLPLFEIASNQNTPFNQLLKDSFLPMKRRLSALETATMQYSDRIHLKEVILSMGIGATIGAGGEILIHDAFPDGGVTAAIARTGTLMVIDMVDGVFGEMGVLTSDLEANGLDLSKDNVFGPDAQGNTKSWWQILKNPFSWKGKAGPFVKRATDSAIKGAITGAALSAPAGWVLSNPKASLEAQAISGAMGTLGTATSIPFNIRATLPQVYLATRMLIEQGKIPVPDDIKKDEKKLKAFALRLAEQDLLSRLGFAASMKAYALTPLSSLILLSQVLGVPREVAQTVFMGAAPAMENLLRLVLTVNRLKFTNPNNMAKAESMILQTGNNSFEPHQDKRLERLFADGFGRGVAWTLTHFPRPVRLPEVDFAKLKQTS